MKLPGRLVRIGAYVCPRGVFAVECRETAGGFSVERTLEVPFALRSAAEAADQLVATLASAGIAHASVSIALRGFGVAHQTLHLPPASDDLLGPIVDREVRRLEPHLTDAVVQWMPLPEVEAPSSAPAQRALLATAAPRETVQVIEERLRTAGHRLQHATALPVAIHRVLEQFDSGTGTIATVVPLPDGAFIGFSLNGGMRIIVEPPLPQAVEHEAPALAEELDLAAMFVRQQFRGVHLDRVVLLGARGSLTDLKPALAERLKIPIKQIEAETLSPAGFVALGALLDARAPSPQSFGGATRARAVSPALSRLETISAVALFVLALVAFWTITETVRTVRAERALATAVRRVESDDFGLASVRSTARQRRVVRDALEAVRVVTADRVELQTALASIAENLRPPMRLDSLRLTRGRRGWRAVLNGGVESTSNARAVQALHDFYRELPQRLRVDSLALDRLTYADSADGGGAVRFQVSFALPTGQPGAQ